MLRTAHFEQFKKIKNLKPHSIARASLATRKVIKIALIFIVKTAF